MGGTKGGAKPGTWVAKLPLKPKDDDDRLVQVGFELGCPGPQVHLGLRFKNQPGGALDGKPFPARVWEQSPHYISVEHPIELAGIKGMTKAQVRLLGTSGAQTPWFDKEDWKAKITAAPRVTAQWFVVHDTGNGDVPVKAPTGPERGAHIFLGGGKLFLNHDFSTSGSATRFEQRHKEFRGQCIHCEIKNDWSGEGPNPDDRYPASDYTWVALAYINASYRAGQWLTITCHLETDRGINGAHHDPRGWNFMKLYRTIGAFVSGANGTFGILQDRIGNNLNDALYTNTFPMQYGPVTYEGRLKKPAMKTAPKR